MDEAEFIDRGSLSRDSEFNVEVRKGLIVCLVG